MEIKEMEAFQAVVEEGNISHAAARLDIAQPALSRQMKRLEESLGVQLFERGSRRIRLTEAGELLWQRVQHILSLVDGTLREITDIGKGVAGCIRLGTITTSGALLLPGLMAEFHRRYPQVTFQIWEGEGSRVLELLDTRIIEVGITRTQGDPNIYESLALPNEPLVVLMNKRCCYCGKEQDRVSIAELKDRPLIIPLRWKSIFLMHCKKQGFEPHLICESDSIVQDVMSVSTGLGMAIIPASARVLHLDDNLVFKRLVEPEIMTHTVVSWLKGRTLSAGARTFIELLREMFLPGK